jgi:hypothetical protein
VPSRSSHCSLPRADSEVRTRANRARNPELDFENILMEAKVVEERNVQNIILEGKKGKVWRS